MNRVTLIGRITKDPEIKYTPTGYAVVQFTLAVERKFKDANGEKQTDFINCVAWRTQAEFIANYVKKGNALAIDGSLQNRSYETQNGERRQISEIIIEHVENWTPREAKAEKPNAIENYMDNQDEDLPF